MPDLGAVPGGPPPAAAPPAVPAPPAMAPAGGARAGAATEINSVWKVGDLDPSGAKIERIYRSTKRFVIYEAAGSTSFILPDDYDTARALRLKVADLIGAIGRIEVLKDIKQISDAERLGAGRVIASALSNSFEDGAKIEDAKALLTDCENRLRTLAKSKLRRFYIYATLGMILAALVALGWVACRTWYYAGTFDAFHRYAVYCAAGALGAFLSVLLGARSLDMSLDVTTFEHFFAGASRIFVGIVAGLIMGLALDSHFVDPKFGHDVAGGRTSGTIAVTIAMYLLLCLISGFSETLVPNLLKRGGQTAGGEQKSDAGGAPNDAQPVPPHS